MYCANPAQYYISYIIAVNTLLYLLTTENEVVQLVKPAGNVKPNWKKKKDASHMNSELTFVGILLWSSYFT